MTAQPGIFALGSRSHYHLELTLRRGAEPAAVAAAVGTLEEPTVTVGGLNLVVGFGPDLWRRLAPEHAPAALSPFRPLQAADGRAAAPATQRDLWVWLHGTGEDVVLDGARAVAAALAPVAELALEQPSFVYHDGRDMTGFVDGTENPPVHEAHAAALVPDRDPGGGGAFAMTMRWVHDLEAFHRLPMAEQEAVIGRTKPDSVQLDPLPPRAHIARAVLSDRAGAELPIYRRSVPFGSAREQGLYFVAFSADPARFEGMLGRMFGLAADGVTDRLTEYSRPVTGSHWFAPSLEMLAGLRPG